MLNEFLNEIVACPRCKSALTNFQCETCRIRYPLVNSVPVLINDSNSLFKIADFTEGRDTTYSSSVPSWKRKLKRFVPSITLNAKSSANFEVFASKLTSREGRPRVLVIGGAVEGDGIEPLMRSDMIDLVESDVAIGDRTTVICDAHDLPFLSSSFDGVVVQAVLEHVLDPFRCVDEIHRVLKADGLVYAESPFMAPVHAGRYDFLRFSHLAHRRLFRRFTEIESGATCGPGTAFAWSYCYFLQSFFVGTLPRQVAFAIGSITGFWLKYFDKYLTDKPGAFDSSLSYYFFGSRSDSAIGDDALIAGYRGSIQ